MKLSRRQLGLGSLGVALSTLVAGAGSASERRFLFVHAEGGWDPLCVFAPLFAAPLIDMEPDAAALSLGGFNLVDGPGRPAVKTFFERWGDQTVLINGLSTRSVNHETCQAVALTGSTSDSRSDWATTIAALQQQDYYLPHLVFNGPSFPGEYTVAVSHAQGLLQQAVDGSIVGLGDMPFDPPGAGLRAGVDSYLAKRAAMLAARYPGSALAANYHYALARQHNLTGQPGLVDFEPAYTLAGHAANAITLLADGVVRCASISTEFLWDSHTDNGEQTPLFQQLFGDLDQILASLASTPSPTGGMLSDDTVVVVLSEMGRTPAYNGTGGRDHWPYTSAMIIGPGVTGGRTIGGYTDLYAGIGVDPASGELDPSRPGVDAKSFGATLLALAGVDPAQHLQSPEVITGIMA